VAPKYVRVADHDPAESVDRIVHPAASGDRLAVRLGRSPAAAPHDPLVGLLLGALAERAELGSRAGG